MMKSTKVILVLGAGLLAFRLLERRNGGYHHGGIPMLPNGGDTKPPIYDKPLPSQLTKVYSISGYEKACVYEYQYSVGNPPQYNSTFVIGDKERRNFYYNSSDSNIMVNGKTASAFTYDDAVNQLYSMANPSARPTEPQKPTPEYTPPTPPTNLRPDFGIGSGMGPLQGW